ncbi:MAG: hypothetical protein JWO31_3024 [Phycisphaerales bacterium]|nr:hypothetical protein [Phycisphaerales bacterium]
MVRAWHHAGAVASPGRFRFHRRDGWAGRVRILAFVPDVPQNAPDILRAAGGRAGVVAGQLDALLNDLVLPRSQALNDADRARGVAALAAAAAALRDVAAACEASARETDGDATGEELHS